MIIVEIRGFTIDKCRHFVVSNDKIQVYNLSKVCGGSINKSLTWWLNGKVDTLTYLCLQHSNIVVVVVNDSC